MLKLWGRANSFNVQKVLWLLAELEVPFEHIPAGGRFGRLDEPGFAALNPHRRVPVLEDGDVAVWESHAVLRHLAERFGGPRWWPDVAARAAILPWMDWHAASFQVPFGAGLFWGFYRTPEPQRDLAAIRRAEADCARQLTFLDGWLAQRPYLAGDELTLADVPIGTCLFRYFEMGVAYPDVPNVQAWYARLRARPAYQAHVMQPFADLKGRLAF
jgi:glutathione S-transferase